MENNKNYNKRRKSLTEFRESYSDNKKYSISTDKKNRGASFLRYFLIAVILIITALAGFLFTDAILEISETPIPNEPAGEEESTNVIDDKYFEGIVTIPADKVTDKNGNNMHE